MNIEVTLNPGIGADLGPDFLLTCDVEGWSDTATETELYFGVEVTIPDGATVIYIQSLGICFNILTLPIETTTSTSTTTSSTSTTTSTTTALPITTTTTSSSSTTTTTTTEGCLGYQYNITFFTLCDYPEIFVYKCNQYGGGGFNNRYELTIGKFYYYDNIAGVELAARIDSFVGCSGIYNKEILDIDQYDSCNDMSCPTTTTTTTIGD